MPTSEKRTSFRPSANGTVTRIVGDSLAYATIGAETNTQAFVSSVVDGFNGESLEKLGIVEGRRVKLQWGPDASVVIRASVLPNVPAPKASESHPTSMPIRANPPSTANVLEPRRHLNISKKAWKRRIAPKSQPRFKSSSASALTPRAPMLPDRFELHPRSK